MFKKRSPASKKSRLLTEIELVLELKGYKFKKGVRIHKEHLIIPDIFIEKMNGTLFKVAVFILGGLANSPDKLNQFYRSLNKYQAMGVQCYVLPHTSNFTSEDRENLEKILTHDPDREYEIMKYKEEEEK